MKNLFEWSEDFSICPQIDEQHKKLIELVNKLNNAFLEGKADEILGEILSQLVDYSHYHFKTEEELFEKFNYSETKKHKAEHKSFVEHISKFVDDFKEGNVAITTEVINFLIEWIWNHIFYSDKKYKNEICR